MFLGFPVICQVFRQPELLGEDGSEERVEQVYRSIGDTIGSPLGLTQTLRQWRMSIQTPKTLIIGDRSFSADHAKVSSACKSGDYEGFRRLEFCLAQNIFRGMAIQRSIATLALPTDERPKGAVL